jgi:isoamylase
MTITMMSLGVPMILMGDEVRRTQRGNNNAYCHDNDLSWFDWTLVEKHAGMHRFVKLLVARRLLRTVKHERERVALITLLQQASKAWHGVKLGEPDWGDDSRSVALSAELRQEGVVCYFILNAYWEALEFELPKLENGGWRRWIDTALDSPDDIAPWEEARQIDGNTYRATDRSVVVLYSKTNR